MKYSANLIAFAIIVCLSLVALFGVMSASARDVRLPPRKSVSIGFGESPEAATAREIAALVGLAKKLTGTLERQDAEIEALKARVAALEGN